MQRALMRRCVLPADAGLPFSASVVAAPMQVSSMRESAVGATEARRTSRGVGERGMGGTDLGWCGGAALP